MSDADTLAAILDAHEPGSHAEVIALIHARGMLRDGAEPAAVLAALEAQREYVRDMTALEQEHGVGAVFELMAKRAQED